MHAELLAMGQAMQLLMPQRNSLLPVSRLPPEILEEVFHWMTIIDPPTLVKESTPHGSRDDWVLRLDLGWIYGATHVCTHWRRLACAQPLFWTRITGALSKRWRDEFFIRSRTALIDVDFLAQAKLYNCAISAELHQYLNSGRLSGLETPCELGQVIELRDFLSRPTSLLRNLHLTVAWMMGPYNAYLPLPLFAGSIPPLESVELHNWSCRWTMFRPFASSLRSLCITRKDSIPRSDQIYGPWEDFVDCMRGLPLLESLKLHRCISSLPSEGSRSEASSVESIPLLHLHELDLYDELQVIEASIRLFKVPATSDFRVRCVIDSVLPNEAFVERTRSLTATFIERCIAYADQVAPIQRLSIRDNGTIHIDMSTCAQYLLDEREDDPEPPELALGFDAGSGDGSVLSSLDFFRNILEEGGPLFNEVEELDVNGASGAWSPEAWIDLFGRFELIDTVQLIRSGRATLTFTRALNMKVPPPNNTGNIISRSAPFIFPKLEVIGFKEADFYASTPRKSQRPLWSALCQDCNFELWSREHPRYLVIEGCTVTPDVMREFGYIWPSAEDNFEGEDMVRWDGGHHIPGEQSLLDRIMWERWDHGVNEEDDEDLGAGDGL
ncbi:hypothetical protein PENSPDRAFT_486611 [Peniophora sp. CONT]|nr:hypothetical protein PENSPDRAFT_486611 [Peniophora sp. CONT]